MEDCKPSLISRRLVPPLLGSAAVAISIAIFVWVVF
jgi:hypothetical protein